MIIANGRLVANDTIDGLMKTYGSKATLEVLCRCSKERAKNTLSAVEGILSVEVCDTEDAGVCSVKLEYYKDNFKYYMNFFVALCVLGLGIIGLFALPTLIYKIVGLALSLLVSSLSLFVWNEKEEVTSRLIYTVEKEVTSFASDNSTKG
jgi:hypothetical protein